MSSILHTTAASLKAVLAYTNPEKTSKISDENDEMADKINKKLLEALGDADGSEAVTLSFGRDEDDLAKEFGYICKNIASIFRNFSEMYVNA